MIRAVGGGAAFILTCVLCWWHKTMTEVLLIVSHKKVPISFFHLEENPR